MLRILSPLVLVLGTLWVPEGEASEKQLSQQSINPCTMNAGYDDALTDPEMKNEIVEGSKGFLGDTAIHSIPGGLFGRTERPIRNIYVEDLYCVAKDSNKGNFATIIMGPGIGQNRVFINFKILYGNKYKFRVILRG